MGLFLVRNTQIHPRHQTLAYRRRIVARTKAPEKPKGAPNWHALSFCLRLTVYWSRKLRSLRDRLGCLSLRSALASIWRIRSRVTLNC